MPNIAIIFANFCQTSFFLPTFEVFAESNYICIRHEKGGIAQLARALAWHARGHGFESHYLHDKKINPVANQQLATGFIFYITYKGLIIRP